MCCRELRPTPAQLAETPAIAAKLRQDATADRLLGRHRHAAHNTNLADLVERVAAAFQEDTELGAIEQTPAGTSEREGATADADSVELTIRDREDLVIEVIPSMIEELEELAKEPLEEGRGEAAERAVALAGMLRAIRQNIQRGPFSSN